MVIMVEANRLGVVKIVQFIEIFLTFLFIFISIYFYKILQKFNEAAFHINFFFMIFLISRSNNQSKNSHLIT
jgi:hypothetical protein